jgi:hypothetical protein
VWALAAYEEALGLTAPHIRTWIRATGYDGRPKPLLKTFVDAAAKKAANVRRD